MSRPGGGAGGGASRGRGRGRTEGDLAGGGEEGRRALERARERVQAAGHDRVVPVLPAAAGRAPFPRPLRYRPCVLTGGCQARACLGGAPRGLGRRASRAASRPLSPGSAKVWGGGPRPRRACPGLNEARAWPASVVGGPLLTPVTWRCRATVNVRRLGEGPELPFSGPGVAERFRSR